MCQYIHLLINHYYLTVIHTPVSLMNISSVFSSNSEANASELLENHKRCFLVADRNSLNIL